MKCIKILQHKVLGILSSVHSMISQYEIATYIIEEINMKSHLVVIRCIGSRTIVKLTLESLVTDRTIINGLSAQQACMVGGYYGRLLRASLEGREAFKKVKNMTFLLNNKGKRYIIAFQNRNGNIGYYDKKTRQEFVEHPLSMVNHDYIIAGFDPSEACYIGILAGINIEKAVSSGKELNSVDSLLNKPPKLRIVK